MQQLPLCQAVSPFDPSGIERHQVEPKGRDDCSGQVAAGVTLSVRRILEDDQVLRGERLEGIANSPFGKAGPGGEILVRRPDQQAIFYRNLAERAGEFTEHQALRQSEIERLFGIPGAGRELLAGDPPLGLDLVVREGSRTPSPPTCVERRHPKPPGGGKARGFAEPAFSVDSDFREGLNQGRETSLIRVALTGSPKRPSELQLRGLFAFT